MKSSPTMPASMDPTILYASKQIKRVEQWRKGKRALVNTYYNRKGVSIAGPKITVRDAWGDPTMPKGNAGDGKNPKARVRSDDKAKQ